MSQRVVVGPTPGTRQDALDQRWPAFLRYCGLHPVPVPNHAAAALDTITSLPVCGILLTGGNDLCAYGGDAPERDAAEGALVDAALRLRLPLLGVCRGMQVLQHRFGVPLVRVTCQVARDQVLTVDGRDRTVNSYHRWAAVQSRSPLRTWVIGPGKVVKAVRHESRPLTGIMWHPERLTPFAAEDRELFRGCFCGQP